MTISMTEQKYRSFLLKLLVCGIVTLLLAGFAPMTAEAMVETKEQKTGVTVYSNDKASIDASNLEEGYVIIQYTGGKDVRIKAQVSRLDGSAYSYDIDPKGKAEIIPLTEGNGKYTIGVFENIQGSKYAQAYSTSVELKLRSEFLPFLYANQYVNFKKGLEVEKRANMLTEGKTKQLDILTAIYNDVTALLTYDTVLAATVQPGYLPDVEKVLERKKGICFDYAALMSSMLRLKGIPSKLVIGYAGKVYHAWLNVYIEDDDTGWIEYAVVWDGKKWSLLDPTFVSTAKSSNAVKQFIGEGNEYNMNYVY